MFQFELYCEKHKDEATDTVDLNLTPSDLLQDTPKRRTSYSSFKRLRRRSLPRSSKKTRARVPKHNKRRPPKHLVRQFIESEAELDSDAAASGDEDISWGYDDCDGFIDYNSQVYEEENSVCMEAVYVQSLMKSPAPRIRVRKEVVDSQEDPNDDETQVHHGIVCDGCGTNPILGTRYSCRQCQAYDLCMFCYSNRNEIHDDRHSFHVHRMPELDTFMSPIPQAPRFTRREAPVEPPEEAVVMLDMTVDDMEQEGQPEISTVLSASTALPPTTPNKTEKVTNLAKPMGLTDEQRHRMELNRKKAEERRRMKKTRLSLSARKKAKPKTAIAQSDPPATAAISAGRASSSDNSGSIRIVVNDSVSNYRIIDELKQNSSIQVHAESNLKVDCLPSLRSGIVPMDQLEFQRILSDETELRHFIGIFFESFMTIHLILEHAEPPTCPAGLYARAYRIQGLRIHFSTSPTGTARMIHRIAA